MTVNDLSAQWLRGLLDPCILALVQHAPTYGYDLRRQMEQAGLGEVAGGSLYPALLRLEKQGLLAAEWRAGEGGPGRKYYRLTGEGRGVVTQLPAAWEQFVDAVGGIVMGVGRR